MKKAVGFVLLILLFLQVGGGYIYFVARLSAIRMEMREQLKTLPDQELTLLTLTESGYKNALVDDHEIKVDDKMYDIARTEKKNGKILVYGLHDEAEDNVLAFLEEMIHRSTDDRKAAPQQLIQLITLQFILPETKLPQNSFVLLEHHSILQIHPSRYISIVHSPPPRKVS